MFSGAAAKIGADFAGTADNCAVIARSAIPMDPSARFLLVGEIPLLEEHIFTDQAYVSICGLQPPELRSWWVVITISTN